MMYGELYQYLVLHKELALPGIGTFLLKRNPAAVDFINKKIDPPSYAFILEQGSYLPGKPFFAWLAHALNISNREAIVRFNDFAFDMKQQIHDGNLINWEGIGRLNKDDSGNIHLATLPGALNFEQPVVAEKVIRQHPKHLIRVGEEEKTTAEVRAILRLRDRKSYWWLYVAILALLAIAFIGWHFYKEGLDIPSTANGQPFLPGESTVTYRLLP